MRFIAFSWGPYSSAKREHTRRSIDFRDHVLHWFDFTHIDDMSCAKGRNLAMKQMHPFLITEPEETFCLIDRDMVLQRLDALPKLPFGVIGVAGRALSVDAGLKALEGERSELYVIPDGYVNTGKGISSVLFMTFETFEYVGEWNEMFTYSEELWGMEDSEWVVRARFKGCEFVKVDAEFLHFDHWIDDPKKLEDLYRRHNNSIKLFEAMYGFSWKDYCRAQDSVTRYLNETVKS